VAVIQSLFQQAAYFRTNTSKQMPKYTATERSVVKSIVASLCIKRIPETEIMKEIFVQTNKSISRAGLYKVKQSIKKNSYKWMMNLAKDRYTYLHEYKERLDEIVWLQKKHHELIDKYTNTNNPHVVQSSRSNLITNEEDNMNPINRMLHCIGAPFYIFGIVIIVGHFLGASNFNLLTGIILWSIAVGLFLTGHKIERNLRAMTLIILFRYFSSTIATYRGAHACYLTARPRNQPR
jgi:hypothetical protein